VAVMISRTFPGISQLLGLNEKIICLSLDSSPIIGLELILDGFLVILCFSHMGTSSKDLNLKKMRTRLIGNEEN